MGLSRAGAIGRETLVAAAECLRDIANRVDPSFDKLIDAIALCNSSVIVTGVGKCRVIAEKIAATLASSGTVAFPMCALEALHGDLGKVRKSDVVIALSTSGETSELLAVVSEARNRGARIAAITRSRSSSLGRAADFVIEIGDHPEAGPHAILPTTSTTAILAVGDAVAMALADRRGFELAEFARVHPAGALGRLSAPARRSA